jgi:hypothetical protein
MVASASACLVNTLTTASLKMDLDSIAVELSLVNPALARGHVVDRGRQGGGMNAMRSATDEGMAIVPRLAISGRRDRTNTSFEDRDSRLWGT